VSWTLRPAGAGDAEAFSATVAIGFDGYRAFAPLGWVPPDATAPDEVARVRERLAAPGTWGLLAEADGAVAGHVAFTPQAGVEGSAHLWMLFVRPAWWGSGLARDLLGRALEEARTQEYRRMRFFTPRDHVRARAFYAREGFRETGVETLEIAIGLMLVEYAREPL
jgi:GNAT superfamily N-acetyltransferase